MHAEPPDPLSRRRVLHALGTGVRADGLVSSGKGRAWGFLPVVVLVKVR